MEKRIIEITKAFEYYRQPNEEGSDSRGPKNFLTNNFERNIERYAGFCKTIPEYCSLNQEDQIQLLKGGVTEAALLRSAIFYADQPEKQLSHLARVLRVIPESSNQLEKAVRHFYKRIFNIKPSSTEMGILVALSLFSADRGTHLSEKRKIEDFQIYFAGLLEYECEKRNRKSEYPKLLLKLSDLRYLHHEFEKIITNESSEPLLTPVLKEIWEFS